MREISLDNVSRVNQSSLASRRNSCFQDGVRLGHFLSTLSFILFTAAGVRAATTIPCHYHEGMIWLKVAVAGKSEHLNFIVDSGAGESVLDIAAVRRLGLKFDDAVTVQGVNGPACAYHVTGLNAKVANAPIVSSLLATDLSAASHSCHQRIDGLLGADFFRDHIVEINYAKQTIRLLQRDEVDLRESDVLALEKCNDAYGIRVSVGGTPPDLFRLDTGCDSELEWVLGGAKAKRIGTITMGLNSGSVRELYTSVQIGTKHIQSVKAGIHSTRMFSGETGLVGNGLLSRFIVTIDMSGGRCLFSNR